MCYTEFKSPLEALALLLDETEHIFHTNYVFTD